MSYNSKRTGQEVENLLDEIDNKVDKVDGKQLSTEDFTTALKDKLNSLNNYDDTEINEAINTLREGFDALVGGDTTTAIKSFNEVIAFLDGISDTQDLAGIISSIEQQIATKMDKTTLATVATSGNYNDLTDKPTIPSEVTESTVSNWGFTKNNGTVTSVKINGSTKASSNGIVDLGTVITEHQDISGKVDKINGKQLTTEDFTTALKNKLESLNNYDDTSIQQAINTLRSDFNTLVSGNTTTAIDNFNEIIAFLDGITDSQNLDNIIANIQLEIAKKQVALISGTNIKTINGQSILGSGNIQINSGSNYELPAATTNTRGGIKIGSGVIVDNTDVLHAKVNESTGLSITNNGIEIKLGTGLKVGDQNRIETNLKTINGQSIEGSGNIEIQGGSGGSGDSSVFITHFTVDEFGSGYVEFTDEQVEAIRDAARQNKIIALPLTLSDGYTGFLVSSYFYNESGISDYWSLELTIIHNAASCTNYMNRDVSYFRHALLSITPFKPLIERVYVDEDGYALADSYNKDNLIVVVEGECRYLQIGEVGYEYGMTVRFFTGEDCAIEYWGNWANGVIPTIEPYTAYEMSIVCGADYNLCAVLTPFKYVE